MLTSLVYYLYLKNSDLEIKYKIAKGFIISFILYYWSYHLIFRVLTYWVIAIDIFILGILVIKYKKKRLSHFLGNFIEDYVILKNHFKVDEISL